MGSRLVNVRLDAARLRKVEQLRKRGVTLADVVRQAIDERVRVLNEEAARDASAIVRNIFERFPDPAGVPARRYDVHDARAARAAVRRKLGHS